MMKNLPKQKSSVNQNQLYLDIEDAPPRVRAYGLSAAHPWPLVGVRDDDGAGRIVRSLRVQQRKAWEYTDVGYPHSATAWCAVVVDVDTPAKIHEVIHGGSSLLPNWIVFNRRNGHAHVCYPLASPVLEHPESNLAPLKYLADVEKKIIAALGGDPGYSGALARNPITKPRWNTETLWFRSSPWELSELDEAATEALPDGWKTATAKPGAVGKNCSLFEGLMEWAGKERNRFESILTQAQAVNATFGPPLPNHEIKSTVKSVAKYRRRWEASGWHSPQWIQKQMWRGERGRAARREKNAERNRAIIAAYDEGMSQSEIARKYGLHRSSIGRILGAKVGGESRRRK